MTDRESFEERLEAAVRRYVEAAPTEINAARLTDSLATSVPRVRRLVSRPGLEAAEPRGCLDPRRGCPPRGGGARPHRLRRPARRAPAASSGRAESGPRRRLPPSSPLPPQQPRHLRSSLSPSPSAAPTASPGSSAPIGVVLPSSFAGPRVAELQDALQRSGPGAQILLQPGPRRGEGRRRSADRPGHQGAPPRPWDGSAAAAAAGEARAAGVKVIAYDRLILDTAAVDYYVTFDSLAVGAAQAQYLIEQAGATKGNNLYLYAGSAADNNSFRVPRRSLAEAPAQDRRRHLRDPELELGRGPAGQSHPDPRPAGQDHRPGHHELGLQRRPGALRSGTWPAYRRPPRAPSSSLPRTTAPRKPSPKRSRPTRPSRRAYVTGQDADKASIQAIIDGRQGMTVFKDPRTLAKDAVAAAMAILTGGTPVATTSYDNGTINVPFKTPRSSWSPGTTSRPP